MSQKRNNPGLETLYTRLDEIRMSSAERQQARAALAQADALADFLLRAVRAAKRLAAPRAGHAHTSA